MFTNLDELKNNTSIIDVVGNFIKLKKQGASYTALCPFHDEKSPSFHIHKSKNNFKCFGCGRSGNAIDFVMQHQGTSFVDAVKIVADVTKFELKLESKEIVKPIPKLNKFSQKIEDWFLKERCISSYTLLRFGITESIEWMPVSKKDVNVICFNYFKNGELVNIKFRGGNKKDMKMVTGAELSFYNIDAIKDTDDCVIVEGEIDCLSLYESSIHNAISVPNGSNTDLRCIDRAYEYFANKKKITIWVDKDDAGKILQENLINRFGRDKCYIVQPLNDCKDANDVLVKYGKEKVLELVSNAELLNVQGVVPTNERKAALIDLYNNGVPTGTPAGIVGLDDHIRFQTGLVTVITGSPSSGKSEFTDFIISNLAVRSGWRFAVFSFENQPTVLHDQKIVEKIAGKAFAFRKESSNRISNKDLDLIFSILDDRFYTIDKTQCDISLDGILQKSEELILRYGIKSIVIDPFNKIHHKTANMYDPSYINDFMSKLTNFAVAWNIHIFLIAHPSKLLKEKSTGKMEVPTLYSISGGANFYNQMDNGIIIHRDRATGLVDVIIGKIRFNEQGKEGFVSFTYNTLTRQYNYATSSNAVTEYYKKPLNEVFIDNLTNAATQQSIGFEDSIDDDDIPF